jgi:hypothetical protein
MKIQLAKTLPFPIDTVEAALLLMRDEQADPNVHFSNRKNTDEHKVFEINYQVPLVLYPFVGSSVILREDIVRENNFLMVTTQSQNYQTKEYPYMYSRTTYTGEKGMVLVQTDVEWWLRDGALPMEDTLLKFGHSKYTEILGLLSDYCNKVK